MVSPAPMVIICPFLCFLVLAHVKLSSVFKLELGLELGKEFGFEFIGLSLSFFYFKNL